MPNRELSNSDARDAAGRSIDAVPAPAAANPATVEWLLALVAVARQAGSEAVEDTEAAPRRRWPFGRSLSVRELAVREMLSARTPVRAAEPVSPDDAEPEPDRAIEPVEAQQGAEAADGERGQGRPAEPRPAEPRLVVLEALEPLAASEVGEQESPGRAPEPGPHDRPGLDPSPVEPASVVPASVVTAPVVPAPVVTAPVVTAPVVTAPVATAPVAPLAESPPASAPVASVPEGSGPERHDSSIADEGDDRDRAEPSRYLAGSRRAAKPWYLLDPRAPQAEETPPVAVVEEPEEKDEAVTGSSLLARIGAYTTSSHRPG